MYRHWMVAGLALLAACTDGEDKDTGPVTDTDTDTQTDTDAVGCTSDLKFTDANNYSYTTELTLQSVTVGAEQDAMVDWSAMTTDFRGRPVSPTDITQVTLARFGLTHEATIEGINSNSIVQADINNYIVYLPQAGETSAPLLDFDFGGVGGDFDPAADAPLGLNESPDASFLITLWVTNELGNYEIVMSQFVVPVAGDANHDIVLTDDSATLTFAADLHTPTPICAPANSPPYSLDWSAVTLDANGKPYDIMIGDLLRITHLPQEDITDVESVFLELDRAATETYYGYITVGSGANPFGYRDLDDLGEAETIDGKKFPGFTTDGTWLVDIECGSLGCFSPAPLILAVVDVQ